MDTNLILSVLIIIFLIIIAIEWDEAFVRFIIGFLAIAFSINIDSVFAMNSASYRGFGQLIQLIYAFVGIFAFVSTFSESLLSRMRKHD